MKKILKRICLLILAFVVLYPIAWITARKGFLGDIEFGYYEELNVAKHAIEETGCAESLFSTLVNEDVTLEEFDFIVTTRSGRVVSLFFDASNMDVNQVCYQPKGLLVWHPAIREAQRYSMTRISELLKGKNFQVRDLKDILCNIDELEEIFSKNHGDANAAREVDPYAWDQLRLYYMTEEEVNFYKEN